MKIIKYGTRVSKNKGLTLVKEASVEYGAKKVKLDSSTKCYTLLDKIFDVRHLAEEHSYLFCLNTDFSIKGVFELATGAINFCPMDMPEIFKRTLLCNSKRIILAHNHPSGDLTPSRMDIEVTKRAVECGKLLGIEVLDHIIVSEEGYLSLRENKSVKFD